MANNELLKASIRSAIKANGNEEITGDILQQTLVAIVDALGKGYQFMGVATPATDPGTTDQKVFYIANGKGVYTNFGGLNVNEDGLILLVYSDAWTKLLGAVSLVDGSVTTPKIANGAVTEEKIADGSITGDKFSPGLTLYMNQQFTYLKQVQVQYGEDPSAAIKSFAQRDNKTALYIKLTNGLLVPANTNGETVSGLYSYGNTVRKVLFDGTNWSDVEIQNDIIDTAHIKNDAVTTNKIGDYAVTSRKIDNKAVTSKKLDQGARNAIVFTPDTTEVYDAIYQKLLSEDVDVIFKANTETVCTLADKGVYDDKLHLYFTNIKCRGDVYNTDIYGVKVDIKATMPHNVLVNVQCDDLFSEFLDQSGYLNKSTLTPILKEIDFTGTDADRKAKLDQFAEDWKALTDASDLTGARFVGLYTGSDKNLRTALFIHRFSESSISDIYEGISIGSDTGFSDISKNMNEKVFVDSYNGSITIIPLFSHLEAITIKTNNASGNNTANISAINAYVDNLKLLGVDVTKGFLIPVYIDGKGSGFLCKNGDNTIYYMGVMSSYGSSSFGISVDAAGNYFETKLQNNFDYSLATDSKQIVGAINGVNALAKGVKAFGAIELKASDNAANKAAVTAYLKILTDAGVSTTNGYSVPVRITGNSQEYHGMLNIGTGVLLSGVVTDVNENHHYPFNVSTTDGAIAFDESNYFLEKTSNEVTEMLDAIKYSHTSVPFTDTTLSNKAQLEVFLSKVPDATVMHCTYKEIWAGTLHKINGDWYGLLVKNTNNPADNINIKLSDDGTITEGNSAQ